MQNVEGILYDPTFPGATLTCVDRTLPVKVTGQFFSPVILHDLKTSGTPGFYAVFTVKNTSAQPCISSSSIPLVSCVHFKTKNNEITAHTA